MIHTFSAENFLSFAGRVNLDFRVGRAVQEDYTTVTSPHGDRISLAMVVLGPNASGKTALLKALNYLSDFAANSFEFRSDGNTKLQPHLFKATEPSSFEVEFEQNGDLFRYYLAVDQNRVLHESLKKKTSRLYSRIFERTWQIEKNQYEIIGAGKKEASQIRENTSLISWSAQYNIQEIMPAFDFFSKFKTNINPYLGRLPPFLSILKTSEMFNSNYPLQKQALKLIQSWDIDIHEVEYEEYSSKDGAKYLNAFSVHKAGDKKFRLPFEEESNGTQTLFTLLGLVLPALNSGGTAVIDEIESDLHPHMLGVVLDLFLRPESNPHGAQIIFTTHAAEVINKFNKPQIILVEKHNMQSEAWSLNDIEGVQSRENHAAKYLAGAYGGIPEL